MVPSYYQVSQNFRLAFFHVRFVGAFPENGAPHGQRSCAVAHVPLSFFGRIDLRPVRKLPWQSANGSGTPRFSQKKRQKNKKYNRHHNRWIDLINDYFWKKMKISRLAFGIDL